MKSTRTKQGNAVFVNGQYYLVNDLTYQLLEMYYERMPIIDIAHTLGMEETEVNRLYKKISDQLLEGKEFKGDIDFLQQLTITGGEALLVNNLAGYVRRCLDRGIRVNLFTNGILLN